MIARNWITAKTKRYQLYPPMKKTSEYNFLAVTFEKFSIVQVNLAAHGGSITTGASTVSDQKRVLHMLLN
ncbi:hypothetical protein Hanom_Chr05g00430941 [Helianthus anomalus]